MLNGNPKLVSVAREAEQECVDPHEVRHRLGRAFLAGIWYHVLEGTSYHAEAMVEMFVSELKRIRGLPAAYCDQQDIPTGSTYAQAVCRVKDKPEFYL
jgi:hypothetical protein